MKTAVLTIAAAVLLMFSACTASEDSADAQESQTESKASQTSSEDSKEEIKTSSSSVNSPLALEAWGAAAKFSTSEQEYYNVPVRLTGIVRGDSAKDEVRAFADESNEYTYKEPSENEEWVLVQYEINLDGFPLDESGADCSIVSFVTGTDGGYVESGGKKYNPVTVNITDGEYYFENTHSGKIAFTLPEACTDYFIVLGEYEETQAFFSVGDETASIITDSSAEDT